MFMAFLPRTGARKRSSSVLLFSALRVTTCTALRGVPLGVQICATSFQFPKTMSSASSTVPWLAAGMFSSTYSNAASMAADWSGSSGAAASAAAEAVTWSMFRVV